MPSNVLRPVLKPELFTHEMFLRLIEERAELIHGSFKTFSPWSLAHLDLFWSENGGIGGYRSHDVLSRCDWRYDGRLFTGWEAEKIRETRGVFGPLDGQLTGFAPKRPSAPSRDLWCLDQEGRWIRIEIGVTDKPWRPGATETQAHINIHPVSLAKLAPTNEVGENIWEGLSFFVATQLRRAAGRLSEAESLEHRIHQDTQLIRELLLIQPKADTPA